jgi:hypothetical protein
MAHDVERSDVPDARETTQADWVPPGRAELARRLDQMADRHPSSTRYDAGDRSRQSSGTDLTGQSDRPATDDQKSPGPQAPEVRGHRDVPGPDAMHTPERSRHILEGDATDGSSRRPATSRA